MIAGLNCPAYASGALPAEARDGAIPAGFFAISEIMATPILFILLICCKIGICRNCCPDDIHMCFKSVMCTPCRWMRISCTGKGEIWCCKDHRPQWPDRPQDGMAPKGPLSLQV